MKSYILKFYWDYKPTTGSGKGCKLKASESLG